MPGGSEAVTWISPIRYIEPFLRRRAFALSWRAVALMMTSARIPGSIRSTSVRAPRPAVARLLFTFACVAGSCAFAATALAAFADASAAFADASAAVFPAVASPLFTFSCVSGSWALADTAPAARADASPASRATSDAFSFAFWRKLTRTSALASHAGDAHVQARRYERKGPASRAEAPGTPQGEEARVGAAGARRRAEELSGGRPPGRPRTRRSGTRSRTRTPRPRWGC